MARSTFGGSAFVGYQSSIVRRALILSALLPVLCAAGEEYRSDRSGFSEGQLAGSWRTPTRLTIVWIDPTRALPFPSALVGREVREVFATLGVTIDWSEAGSEPIEGPETLRVILLRVEPSAWRFERSVLRERLDRRALLRASVDLDLESREVFLSVLAARQPERLARRPPAGRGLTPRRTVASREPNATAWLQRLHRPFGTGPPQ
jgi:hypothetical protein